MIEYFINKQDSIDLSMMDMAEKIAILRNYTPDSSSLSDQQVSDMWSYRASRCKEAERVITQHVQQRLQSGN